MQIYILDDDEQVVAANRFLLNAMGHGSQGWSSPQQFLDELDDKKPAILLLDLAMPELDGLAVLSVLQQRRSTVAVILLTGHGDVPQAVEAMKLGAVDFLEKPIDARRLTAALAQARLKVDQLVEQARVHQCFTRLSAREREVVSLVAQGLTNKAIAEQLCVAVRTVEVHRASAMNKLNVANMAELLNHWQLYRG
ncbi:response regulator transcription factor [Oceanisphaera arctica]|uniref:DNA-binding response regulator n=1 Tax=Oceanisphaera arctica TaxID=641510 RepID=A0A2P5TL40_9GAMM|nr:response regulator [Oceanisphaera arctica]PPL15971.1 DNA-binding response regulator [Oceanisphaera arctica]GHA21437.1 DNA-binding response regulator [Oceanisphaera arctica]